MKSLQDLIKHLEAAKDVKEIVINGVKLPNTAETWARIGNKDSFHELGLSGSELDDFLKTFTEENDYNNI
jgi:hypothetical protein